MNIASYFVVSGKTNISLFSLDFCFGDSFQFVSSALLLLKSVVQSIISQISFSQNVLSVKKKRRRRRKEKKEKERKENESLNFLSGWSVSISGQIKERLRQYKSSYFYNEIQYSLCIRRFMQHIFFIFANFILCPNVVWSKLMVIFLGSKCTLDSILWIK